MAIIVTVRDATRREELADKISALQTVDASLRKSFAGFDADSIVPEARSSLGLTGVEMSDEDLHAYATSIAERTDFEYTLD